MMTEPKNDAATASPLEDPVRHNVERFGGPTDVGKSQLTMPKKIVVLYHAHCADGFAAALTAWAVFGEYADYLPVEHQQPMPRAATAPGVEWVYILDFSYPRARLEEMLDSGIEVVVIDHHKTAEANLRGLTNCLFDLEKSGAVLAFEYFREHFPESIYGAPQELLRYVQDRDLWRWELPQSREVNAALASRPLTFEEWAGIVDQAKAGIAQLAYEGRHILRAQAQMVESIVAREYSYQIFDPSKMENDRIIPVVNTPVLQSECCHRLLELHPEAPFVAAFFQGKDGIVWSLRSRPGGFDVAAFAQQRGGGGHPCAAGFTENLT